MSIPAGLVVVAGWNVVDKTGAVGFCMTVYANSCSDQCTARGRCLAEMSYSFTMQTALSQSVGLPDTWTHSL